MRWLALVAPVAACENAPIEKPEVPPTTSLDPRPRPPPPPPPPPVEPGTPLQQVITDFRRAHARDPEPWRVTFTSLDEYGKVVRRKDLSDASAAEVVAWLGDPQTYVTESGTRRCGWVTPELVIDVERGSQLLRKGWDCDYLYLDEDRSVPATVGNEGIVRFNEIEKRSGFWR